MLSKNSDEVAASHWIGCVTTHEITIEPLRSEKEISLGKK